MLEGFGWWFAYFTCPLSSLLFTKRLRHGIGLIDVIVKS
jgi:hypothetical protein